MNKKSTQIVESAKDLASSARNWADLSNALFDPVDGLIAKAFPTMTHEQLLAATHKITPRHYEPGAMILTEGKDNDKF